MLLHVHLLLHIHLVKLVLLVELLEHIEDLRHRTSIHVRDLLQDLRPRTQTPDDLGNASALLLHLTNDFPNCVAHHPLPLPDNSKLSIPLLSLLNPVRSLDLLDVLCVMVMNDLLRRGNRWWYARSCLRRLAQSLHCELLCPVPSVRSL